MSIDQWYVYGNKNDISSFHLDFMLVFFSRNVGLSSCYVDANHVMKLRFHRSDFSSYQMTPNLYLKGEIRISTTHSPGFPIHISTYQMTNGTQ